MVTLRRACGLRRGQDRANRNFGKDGRNVQGWFATHNRFATVEAYRHDNKADGRRKATLPGNSFIAATDRIRVTSFRQNINGLWSSKTANTTTTANTATHVLAKNGCTTTIPL